MSFSNVFEDILHLWNHVFPNTVGKDLIPHDLNHGGSEYHGEGSITLKRSGSSHARSISSTSSILVGKNTCFYAEFAIRMESKDVKEANADYIDDIINEIDYQRIRSQYSPHFYTPYKAAKTLWNNLRKSPYLGPARIHLQYQSTEIYKTNIAAVQKMSPGIPRVDTNSKLGGAGRFTCGGGGRIEDSVRKPMDVPNFVLRAGANPVDTPLKIRVQLYEKDHAKRLLWDAVYDKKLSLEGPLAWFNPAFNLNRMVPVLNESRKPWIDYPCIPADDPEPHWFELKITTPVSKMPRALKDHTEEGWKGLGKKPLVIGFTVQRHPITRIPDLRPWMPFKPEKNFTMPSEDYVMEDLVGGGSNGNAGVDRTTDYRPWNEWAKRDVPDNGAGANSWRPRYPTHMERRNSGDSDPNFVFDTKARKWKDNHGYYWWLNKKVPLKGLLTGEFMGKYNTTNPRTPGMQGFQGFRPQGKFPAFLYGAPAPLELGFVTNNSQPTFGGHFSRLETWGNRFGSGIRSYSGGKQVSQ